MKQRIQGFAIGFITAFIMLFGISVFNHTISDNKVDVWNGVYPDWDAPLNNVSKKYTGVPLVTPKTKQEIEYYSNLGITYDEDKKGYCYEGKLVGLFIDRRRAGQGVVFLSDYGEINIQIKRDGKGKMTGVKILSDNVDWEMGKYFVF